MKSIREIKQHIKKMDAEKRKRLKAMAAADGMTLVKYLADLYGWGEANTGSVIVVKNSNTGNIIQNG